MAVKYPYRDLPNDERDKVMSDTRDYAGESFEDHMKDRSSGINAEPNETYRDGVTSVKRMHPDRYIRNGGCN